MNKFTKQEIGIDQYLAALEDVRPSAAYRHVSHEHILLANALAKLIKRYAGKIDTNQYDEEKLEIIKEFCDEYISVRDLATNSSYKDWTDTEWADIPTDIKENVFTAAKEPSQREKDEHIRQKIGKLLDK